MTAKLALRLITLAFLLSSLLWAVVAAAEVAVQLPCDGTVGDCLWTERAEEADMDSEASRRVLWAAAGAVAQKKYVSYEALKGDVVPCTRPGVPYYSCHALPKTNPYSRGCQIISGCRDGSP